MLNDWPIAPHHLKRPVAEHALDAIAIPVAAIVWVFGCLAVRTRRDDRQDAMHQEVLPEGIATGIVISASAAA